MAQQPNPHDTPDAVGSDAEGETVVVADLSRPEVTTKYRTAADITNAVLQAVVDACKPGADIATLCKMGDAMIEERCDKVYAKKEKGEKIRKGVAFPTCITPNELCANYSPLLTESTALKDGDLVKVDVGCHIDGFIAVAAHTLVIGDVTAITGRKADVLRAGWAAAEVALRTVVIGGTNKQVTSALNDCVADFDCKMVQGIQSHQMKQHVIDGVRSIHNRPAPDAPKVDTFEFEVNEVYGIDILVSTGEGKPKESELRTCVFKRNVDQTYGLRTPLARQFMRETTTRFPLLPFTARAIEDANLSRVGISECMRHGLFQAYPVMTEKPGEFVVHFKFTVMLLPGGTKKVTGLPLAQEAILKSDFHVQCEYIKTLLASSANPKKKKKKARAELKEAALEGTPA